MRRLRLAPMFFALAALAACQVEQRGPAAGAERGACKPGGACDPGLTCLSELCVRPPGADCAAVARHLDTILLGNYAERDERARFDADTTAACQAAQLDAAAGACLTAATTRQQVGACPHPLGVGDCAKITAHLKTLVPTSGPDQYLVTSADQLIARCKNEIPSRALEACVLAAHSVADVDHCAW